jgi:FAD/FMN-containing dehydrogenase
LPASPYTLRHDFLSWGRVARRPQRVASPRFRSQLPGMLSSQERGGLLATGLRRSYGDSCLNSEGATIDMRGLDRFIAFDAATGILRAEAGVSLAQILTLIVPCGWFLPTTPGTRFVTLGGALANDVHGKNHHRAGSFGCHVLSFGLLRSDGFHGAVSVDRDPRLFAATIGGLGLTGVIDWVEIQLERVPSAFLEVETLPYGNLDEFWALAEESTTRFEHTVAWIDATSHGAKFGRGVFSRANWHAEGALTVHGEHTWKNLPLDAPSFLLNRFTVAGFNELYTIANKTKARRRVQHYAPFFYPLDTIHNWNRLYGWRGMYQYQCVIPMGAAPRAIDILLKEITHSGQASFLAVLKTFGQRPSPGLLSFPRPGATLALDFPNRGKDTLELLSRLDAVVLESGGALYPAKDGRVSAEAFQRSFPRWRDFLKHKDEGMSSDFWRRAAA